MSLQETDYAMGECLHCHNDYEVAILTVSSYDVEDVFAVCSYCIKSFHLLFNITFFPPPSEQCDPVEHEAGYFAGGKYDD